MLDHIDTLTFRNKKLKAKLRTCCRKGLSVQASALSRPLFFWSRSTMGPSIFLDYRAPNAITVKDHFPIPMIDELLDKLGSASWFSKLDLLHGYHQIRMHEPGVAKTAFQTHHGHYEFKVMSFGLCNTPSSFQATMNEIFRPYLSRFIIVFFDDILIYSHTLADHLIHLERALKVLLNNQFVLKFSKCFFAQQQVEYLGHVISGQGVTPVASKVQAIHQWPVLKMT